MTHRPEDQHPDVPLDEYWELLRESLRSAVGRAEEPAAPAPVAHEERTPARPAPIVADAPPSEGPVERYGWAM